MSAPRDTPVPHARTDALKEATAVGVSTPASANMELTVSMTLGVASAHLASPAPTVRQVVTWAGMVPGVRWNVIVSTEAIVTLSLVLVSVLQAGEVKTATNPATKGSGEMDVSRHVIVNMALTVILSLGSADVLLVLPATDANLSVPLDSLVISVTRVASVRETSHVTT